MIDNIQNALDALSKERGMLSGEGEIWLNPFTFDNKLKPLLEDKSFSTTGIKFYNYIYNNVNLTLNFDSSLPEDILLIKTNGHLFYRKIN